MGHLLPSATFPGDKDLTQEFFLHLLQGDWIGTAEADIEAEADELMRLL